MADRTMTTECPRRAERLSRELGDGGKGVCPSGELVGTAPWVRYLPSIGPRSFFAVARIRPAASSIRHRVEASDKRAKGLSAILLLYALDLDGREIHASIKGDASG